MISDTDTCDNFKTSIRFSVAQGPFYGNQLILGAFAYVKIDCVHSSLKCIIAICECTR